MIWLLAGCESDPVRDAWHRAIEVDTVTRANEACDGEQVPSEPVEPYLFVAVSRGIPDSSSLYWCGTPESCGTPFANVYLTEPFDETQLQGELASAAFDEGLCSVVWTRIAATREGDQVALLYEAGLVNALGVESQACADLADSAIGEACEVVLEISGTQVE